MSAGRKEVCNSISSLFNFVKSKKTSHKYFFFYYVPTEVHCMPPPPQKKKTAQQSRAQLTCPLTCMKFDNNSWKTSGFLCLPWDSQNNPPEQKKKGKEGGIQLWQLHEDTWLLARTTGNETNVLKHWTIYDTNQIVYNCPIRITKKTLSINMKLNITNNTPAFNQYPHTHTKHKKLSWGLRALRHSKQKLMEANLGLPPYTVPRMTGLGENSVWTMM